MENPLFGPLPDDLVRPAPEGSRYHVDDRSPRRFTEKVRGTDGWSLEYSARMPKQPELSEMDLGGGHPVVAHCEVPHMIVRYEAPKIKRSLDLVKILPEGWKIEALQPANWSNMPPEYIERYKEFQQFDPDRQKFFLAQFTMRRSIRLGNGQKLNCGMY